MKPIFEQYHNWLEEILSGELPEGINGFAVNLYEGMASFEAELVAAPEFDKDNEDWACDDIYMSARFEFLHEIIGSSWEPALNKIVDSTKAYIMTNTSGARLLKSVRGVGVGFVDGALVLVHVNA